MTMYSVNPGLSIPLAHMPGICMLVESGGMHWQTTTTVLALLVHQ